MKRVLLIGIHPDAVDTSDPSLPPGLTSEKIAKGIETTLSDMRERGWVPAFCAIHPASAQADVVASLAERWDCVVIGGGIRIPPSNLGLFEMIVNTIMRAAPATPIAFNTVPENTADAAARWLK
jgi:hypothetical protein